MVDQKWRRMVSDGSRRRSGTSSLSLRQERSRRHIRGGSQPNPPSISTTCNPGNRSNTPSRHQADHLGLKGLGHAGVILVVVVGPPSTGQGLARVSPEVEAEGEGRGARRPRTSSSICAGPGAVGCGPPPAPGRSRDGLPRGRSRPPTAPRLRRAPRWRPAAVARVPARPRSASR